MKLTRPEVLRDANKKNRTTIFCWAYPSDLNQFYAFYCARYRDISYDTFLNLGLNEALIKLNSIPEIEPLYKIIKSRTINITEIKNKDEKKYWQKIKKINKIPAIFLPIEELDYLFKEELERGRKGFN